MGEHGRLGPMEWATAARARSGEIVCGDRWVAVASGPDAALFGVIDGLGHGEPAAAAARCAEQVLTTAGDRPLEDLITLCHRELAATRGAAITLVRTDFASGTLHWTGVGNVSAHLLTRTAAGVDSRSTVRLLGGIVGDQLPDLTATDGVALRTGNILVMATDGIGENHTEEIEFAATAETLAERILRGHRRGTDDALVLVAKHRGVAT
jgi:hypothetical protein